MTRIHKILCPVNFSGVSRRAVDYAIQLAESLEAELSLLHIVGPILPSSYELSMNIGEILKALSNEATSRLKEWAKNAESAGVPIRRTVRIGEIEDLIVRAIHSEKVDLIVVGGQGGGVFEQRVVRSAICPVLIVPARGTPRQKPSAKKHLSKLAA